MCVRSGGGRGLRRGGGGGGGGVGTGEFIEGERERERDGVAGRSRSRSVGRPLSQSQSPPLRRRFLARFMNAPICVPIVIVVLLSSSFTL